MSDQKIYDDSILDATPEELKIAPQEQLPANAMCD